LSVVEPDANAVAVFGESSNEDIIDILVGVGVAVDT
jgi:hypothetical protein